MNAVLRSKAAYASGAPAVRTASALEVDLLTRVTAELEAASASRDTDFPRFAKALHANRQVWDVFGADVAGEGNGLVPELRARIFYLSEFTRNHSKHLLRTVGEATPLLAINRAVIAGLSERAIP